MPTMSNEDRRPGEWYYRQDGQTFGPVSLDQLREQLTTGQLQPRQAVWKQRGHGLLFIHAATAVFGSKDASCFTPSSEPMSA
jgi:hypothetical protein